MFRIVLNGTQVYIAYLMHRLKAAAHSRTGFFEYICLATGLRVCLTPRVEYGPTTCLVAQTQLLLCLTFQSYIKTKVGIVICYG